jgi:hypothetical protein
VKLMKVGTFRKGTWWGEVWELYIVADSSRALAYRRSDGWRVHGSL